jgi:hypothetical protein
VDRFFKKANKKHLHEQYDDVIIGFQWPLLVRLFASFDSVWDLCVCISVVFCYKGESLCLHNIEASVKLFPTLSSERVRQPTFRERHWVRVERASIANEALGCPSLQLSSSCLSLYGGSSSRLHSLILADIVICILLLPCYNILMTLYTCLIDIGCVSKCLCSIGEWCSQWIGWPSPRQFKMHQETWFPSLANDWLTVWLNMWIWVMEAVRPLSRIAPLLHEPETKQS